MEIYGELYGVRGRSLNEVPSESILPVLTCHYFAIALAFGNVWAQGKVMM